MSLVRAVETGCAGDPEEGPGGRLTDKAWVGHVRWRPAVLGTLKRPWGKRARRLTELGFVRHPTRSWMGQGPKPAELGTDRPAQDLAPLRQIAPVPPKFVRIRALRGGFWPKMGDDGVDAQGLQKPRRRQSARGPSLTPRLPNKKALGSARVSLKDVEPSVRPTRKLDQMNVSRTIHCNSDHGGRFSDVRSDLADRVGTLRHRPRSEAHGDEASERERESEREIVPIGPLSAPAWTACRSMELRICQGRPPRPPRGTQGPGPNRWLRSRPRRLQPSGRTALKSCRLHASDQVISAWLTTSHDHTTARLSQVDLTHMTCQRCPLDG